MMGTMQRQKRIRKEFRGQAKPKVVSVAWRNLTREFRAFAVAVASLTPEKLEAIRRGLT